MIREPYPDTPATREEIEAVARKVIADHPAASRAGLVALTLRAFKGVGHPGEVAKVIDQILAE